MPTRDDRGARASGRRLRLRGRRPDRPARVPRVAPARGLPLPRRHRALPVRRPLARGAARRSRSSSPASCSSAAPSCWWWPATPPRPPRCPSCKERLAGRVPVIGVVSPESRLAAAATQQPAGRPARHPGHRGQRRLRARARRGVRRDGDAPRGRLARARAAHPGGRRGGRAHGRRRSTSACAPLREAERGHGDPRLHPLPARAAADPAHAGARRRDRHAPGEAIADEVADELERDGIAARREAAGATTASSARATPRSSAAWARASSSCRSREVGHVQVDLAGAAA